ncbi:MAG TPA: glycosyltransferase family 2 protein [bacterium]|nr:glycosyltransferase family 2 protein [bacterium]
MLVSVFIPFCNEENNLSELIERVQKGGIDAGVDLELILVDDGSRDNSYKVAEEYARTGNWIKIFRHQRNKGLTEAMITGFKECTGEIIIFLPADLESYPDEDIPALLKGFTPDVDIVCGNRLRRREFKVFLSKIYNEISNFLFGIDLHDMNWIKAFRRECLKDLELRSDWHRFFVQILHQKGYKAVEVPVKWYKRKSGKSHFGLKRIPISFFDSIAVKFVLTFTKAPMRIFGAMGFIQIFIALIIVSWMLYSQFVLGQSAFRVRPLLYFSVALFLSGLIFVFMGFIAELVVSLKDEIRKMREQK